MSTVCKPENGHWNSEFSHEKWWLSIVFCMLTRGSCKDAQSQSIPIIHCYQIPSLQCCSGTMMAISIWNIPVATFFGRVDPCLAKRSGCPEKDKYAVDNLAICFGCAFAPMWNPGFSISKECLQKGAPLVSVLYNYRLSLPVVYTCDIWYIHNIWCIRFIINGICLYIIVYIYIFSTLW